ncbi:Uncharacterised protein [Chryseobacterium nakagawai]|uniref:Uncharacterized protein n=1 Tax=Chryseobacterium nakagawai TaxID=1241982 RepID=A0AAD0YNV3_CHRNA|nr:hypothetical protein [Chryseobacterium nakagawai]AZA91989.1 hypothetical protein EG343_15845 [Chryseobacterium nakagawai]VEH18513.1 Uncharacterised protein [Chryseobacterium nakagawai]
MKTKIINYIIGLIFLIYYCICISNSYIQLVFHKNGWYLGEWLINYQDGGFKRRGLFGSLFIFLNELTNIKLEFLVFTFVSIVYAIFFTLLIQLFMQKKNTLLTISILLLPAGMGMVLKDPTIIAKKEIIIFLLYLIYFLRLESKKTVKDIAVSFFIILAILNHEAAFFYIPFVSFTYFIKDSSPSFTKAKKIILYHFAPGVIILLLLYKFGYSITTPNSIQFLQEHGLKLILKGIYGYDPNYNVLNFYKAHSYGYFTYLISLFFATITYYIYCRSNEINIHKKFLIIQAIFLIPLFYVAYDWGRWINIFFTLFTIFIAGEPQLAPTLKKDITGVILILFNSLWKMLLFTAGFLTFPVIDTIIKKLYYFIYFKLF